MRFLKKLCSWIFISCLVCLRYIAFGIGLAAGILVLAGRFPEFFWQLDQVAHFAFQLFLLLTGIILVLFSLGIRKHRWFLPLLLLPFWVLNLLVLLPPFLLYTAGQKELPGARYKLIELNARIMSCDRQDVADFLERENPDIMVIPEYSSRLHKNLQETIGERYPYIYFKFNDLHEGIAVYSRYPAHFFVYFENLLQMPVVRANVELENGQKLDVFAMRAPSPRNPELVFIRNRMLQFSEARIAERKIPTILVGDLNSSPFSTIQQQLIGRGNLRWGAFPLLFTWPATPDFSPFWIQIDHCLTSDGVRLLSAKRGPLLSSDHYPVIFEFQLDE